MMISALSVIFLAPREGNSTDTKSNRTIIPLLIWYSQIPANKFELDDTKQGTRTCSL